MHGVIRRVRRELVSGCVSAPSYISVFFFFNDTATPEIYTLSLHDALPISGPVREAGVSRFRAAVRARRTDREWRRSEEHTSELQSRLHLVCRLLLEKKKNRPSVALARGDANSCHVA